MDGKMMEFVYTFTASLYILYTILHTHNAVFNNNLLPLFTMFKYLSFFIFLSKFTI